MSKKEHGLRQNEAGIIDLSVASIDNSSKNKETYKFEKEHALDKMRGVFRNYDRPGQALEFNLSKYGFPVRFFELKDKQEYILPRYVAVHLKNTGKKITQAWVMGPDGRPHKDAGSVEKRYDFDCPELAYMDMAPEAIFYTGVTVN